MSNQAVNFKSEQSILFLTNDFDQKEFESKIVDILKIDNKDIDFNYISPDKTQAVSVDQIREIITEFSKKDISHHFRIFVLMGGGDIGHVGQNALLKILEEPPVGILLVLIVDNIKTVLETIRSRCKVVYGRHIDGENNTQQEKELLLKAVKNNTKDAIYDIDKNTYNDLNIVENSILLKRTKSLIDVSKTSKLLLIDLWTKNT